MKTEFVQDWRDNTFNYGLRIVSMASTVQGDYGPLRYYLVRLREDRPWRLEAEKRLGIKRMIKFQTLHRAKFFIRQHEAARRQAEAAHA